MTYSIGQDLCLQHKIIGEVHKDYMLCAGERAPHPHEASEGDFVLHYYSHFVKRQ